jgi:hypothetical protein
MLASFWGNGVEDFGFEVKMVFGSSDHRIWGLRCWRPFGATVSRISGLRGRWFTDRRIVGSRIRDAGALCGATASRFLGLM